MRTYEPISLSQFGRTLADYFGLAWTDVEGTSRLAEDLGFDSVMMIEVALFLEEMADQPVPEELLTSLETVGDIHHYYCVYAGHELSRERAEGDRTSSAESNLE